MQLMSHIRRLDHGDKYVKTCRYQMKKKIINYKKQFSMLLRTYSSRSFPVQKRKICADASDELENLPFKF